MAKMQCNYDIQGARCSAVWIRLEPRCTGETAKFQSRGRWSFLATPQTRRGKREKCQSSAVCPCPHSLELSAQSDTISQNTCVGGVWVRAAFNYHVKLIYHVVKQTSTVTPMSIWLRQTRWNTFFFFFVGDFSCSCWKSHSCFHRHVIFLFFLKEKVKQYCHSLRNLCQPCWHLCFKDSSHNQYCSNKNIYQMTTLAPLCGFCRVSVRSSV